MLIVDHPKVKSTRISVEVNFPDLTIKRILIVEAQMPLHESEPGYDAAEFSELTDAIVAVMEQDQSIDSARVIPIEVAA